MNNQKTNGYNTNKQGCQYRNDGMNHSHQLNPQLILEELRTLQSFVDQLEAQHAEEKKQLIHENNALKTRLNNLTNGKQTGKSGNTENSDQDYLEVLLKEKNSDIISMRETIYQLTEAKKKAELQVNDLEFNMENKLKNSQFELQSKDIEIQRLKNELTGMEEKMDKQNRRERALIEELNVENANLRKRLGIISQELEQTEQKVYDIRIKEKQAHDDFQNVNFERRVRNRVLYQSSNVIWCLRQIQSRKTVTSAFELWRKRLHSKRRENDNKQADMTKSFSDVLRRIKLLSETLRDKTVRFAFQIFADSVTKASKTKQNSLNIFTKEFSHSKERLKGLYKTTLDAYMNTTDIISSYSLGEALYLNPMNIVPKDLDDQNKWILQNLISLLNNPQLDVRSTKNKEKEQTLTLYRLFLLIHKISNPLKKKSTELNPKLKDSLYHCILLHLMEITGNKL